eukprot:SAG22_NODE_1152_length_5349_cov_34.917905_3_plen_256_part_00
MSTAALPMLAHQHSDRDLKLREASEAVHSPAHDCACRTMTATATYAIRLEAIPAGSAARIAFETGFKDAVDAHMRKFWAAIGGGAITVMISSASSATAAGSRKASESVAIDFSIRVLTLQARAAVACFTTTFVKAPSTLRLCGVTPTVTAPVMLHDAAAIAFSMRHFFSHAASDTASKGGHNDATVLNILTVAVLVLAVLMDQCQATVLTVFAAGGGFVLLSAASKSLLDEPGGPGIPDLSLLRHLESANTFKPV